MPEKTKLYHHIRFTPELIKEADIILKEIIEKHDINPSYYHFNIETSDDESWSHNNEDEFFADYSRGFNEALFIKSYGDKGAITFSIHNNDTRVSVSLYERKNIEKVFNHLEANMDKCRLPEEPKSEQKEIETNWAIETINKIKTHCPNVARKLKIALIKIESKDKEEWQNAAVQIRDSWIELSQWLCKAHNIDTSDISPDSVIDRLKRLNLDKSDDKIFNLAKASFQFSMKHHKRDIDLDTAVACVISAIVSMKTVIQEVFNAHTKS